MVVAVETRDKVYLFNVDVHSDNIEYLSELFSYFFELNEFYSPNLKKSSELIFKEIKEILKDEDYFTLFFASFLLFLRSYYKGDMETYEIRLVFLEPPEVKERIKEWEEEGKKVIKII